MATRQDANQQKYIATAFPSKPLLRTEKKKGGGGRKPSLIISAQKSAHDHTSIFANKLVGPDPGH